MRERLRRRGLVSVAVVSFETLVDDVLADVRFLKPLQFSRLRTVWVPSVARSARDARIRAIQYLRSLSVMTLAWRLLSYT